MSLFKKYSKSKISQIRSLTSFVPRGGSRGTFRFFFWQDDGRQDTGNPAAAGWAFIGRAPRGAPRILYLPFPPY
jgi:hypothetical protein